MITQRLNPYNNCVKRYPCSIPVLFVCDSSISNFDVILPDAQAVRNIPAFYFQKDVDDNIVYIVTQYGQSICGVGRVSLVLKYHTIMVVSDGAEYRILQGVVAEIPATFTLGPYWRFRPTGYDLNLERDPSYGSDPAAWTAYDEMFNERG